MSGRLRPALTAVLALLPSPLARWALNAIGHRIGPRVRIGWSLLLVDRLWLQGPCRIGHGNLLRLRRLVARQGAYVGRANIVHGPISVQLAPRAAIGNGNKISRGPLGPVTAGPARLKLGELAKITADHRIDCTCSIWIGDFSTIAGTSSEFWTHGYVHSISGSDRYRVDGGIRIGNNVYVGSASIVTTGVRLGSGVIIGAGTTVARSIDEPGMYVSAPLRRLERPADPDSRTDLHKRDDAQLCERVYVKQDR